jgi:hypothetical protein
LSFENLTAAERIAQTAALSRTLTASPRDGGERGRQRRGGSFRQPAGRRPPALHVYGRIAMKVTAGFPQDELDIASLQRARGA